MTRETALKANADRCNYPELMLIPDRMSLAFGGSRHMGDALKFSLLS